MFLRTQTQHLTTGLKSNYSFASSPEITPGANLLPVCPGFCPGRTSGFKRRGNRWILTWRGRPVRALPGRAGDLAHCFHAAGARLSRPPLVFPSVPSLSLFRSHHRACREALSPLLQLTNPSGDSKLLTQTRPGPGDWEKPCAILIK